MQSVMMQRTVTAPAASTSQASALSRPSSLVSRRHPVVPGMPLSLTTSSCAAPGVALSRPRAAVVPCAFNSNNNGDVGDRVLASLPYLLPLLDAFPFAKFMMVQYPFIARAFTPLGPLLALYHSFPFAPFLVFLAIYSGVVNNQSLSRFVRYNAMQAVLLDILLIIPQVVLQNVVGVPQDELGFQAYVSATNTIFLFVAVCTAYGMGSCLVGQTPRLPLVAEAADSQMMR